ncbi:MAG: dockerin type I repeat-containing protein, partial [Muribaculaceae bacterium]|nr:dockerin type I repeat-containing protein [Muribaculaceae bacterium]
QEVILPLQLNAGESKTLQFDCNNVHSGEKYYVWVYYYSEGKQVRGRGTSTYTLVFPADAETKKGDLNGDGKVDVEDVNIAINVILGLNTDKGVKAKADLNNDGKVDVEDVNAIINIILK